MRQIFNKKITFLVLFLVGFFWANAARAFCPVCVVAVGAGLGLSRWLGVDDVVSSVWIGGLLWAVSAWTVIWLKTKDPARLNAAKPQFRFAKLFNRVKNFKYYEAVAPITYYALVLGPLYYYGIIGHPENTIWGIDKIIFGAVIGTLVFVGGTIFHNYLKTKNNGKSYFNYQKVVVPFSALFIISLTFYFLIPWI